MAGKDGNSDAAMSAHLKAMGYPHGRRKTATHAPPVPDPKHIGSAAYRRLMAKKTASGR